MNYPTASEMRAARRRMGNSRLEPMERWEASYSIEPSGCWRWIKARTGSGYGHFALFGRYYQAHRLAYILHKGSVAPELELDHLCRNRWCINPDHLEPVTHAQNSQRGAGTRLTLETVEGIRRAVANGARSQRGLARALGIDHSTISRLVRFERWAA